MEVKIIQFDDIKLDFLRDLLERTLYNTNGLKLKYTKALESLNETLEEINIDIDVIIDILKDNFGYDDEEIKEVITQEPKPKYIIKSKDDLWEFYLK